MKSKIAAVLFCLAVLCLPALADDTEIVTLPLGDPAIVAQIVIITKQVVVDFQGLASSPGNPPAGAGRLYYNTGTSLLACNNPNGSSCLGGGAAASVPFSGVTAGTNSTAALVVGTGASLGTSGSGTIAATSCPTCAVPRLDQVLDPNTNKTFAMGNNLLSFNYALTAGAGNGVPFDVNIDGSSVPAGDSNGTTAFQANFVDSVEHTVPNGDFMEAASVQTSLQINGGGNTAEVDALSINNSVVATAGDITLARMDALDVAASFGASGGHTGVITDMSGVHVLAAGVQGTASATNYKAIAVESQSGTITNKYALWMDDVAGGSNNWAIKTGLGKVQFNDAVNANTSTGGAAGVFNAATGFRIAGAAASGHYLRGNGTNYVDGAIQSGDVPACPTCVTSAAALTLNTLVKGQGLQASANSSVTDDGTNTIKSPNGISVQLNNYDRAIPNANPGSTVHRAVCLDSSANAITCGTSTLGGVAGTADEGAGNTGNVQVCMMGQCIGEFDGNAAINNWAILSPTTAGRFHDTGSTAEPTGQQAFFIYTTNSGGAGGTASIGILNPDVISGGNGGGGGRGTNVQVNGTNTQPTANLNGTTPTAQANNRNLVVQSSNSGAVTRISVEVPLLTTSQPGLAPTLSNVVTQFLDGTGAYSVPAGGGTAGNGFAWGGDGSDSVLNFDGTNTFAGIETHTGSAPNFVYTLVRDVWATTLTVASGKTLKTAQSAVFATTSVTVNGTLRNNGLVGTTASSRAGAAGGAMGETGTTSVSSVTLSYPLYSTGAAGAAGSAGGLGATGVGPQGTVATAGTNGSNSICQTLFSPTTWNGGAGGTSGTVINAGGALRASGANGTVTARADIPRTASRAVNMQDGAGNQFSICSTGGGGAGGGAGGGDGTNAGGSGGGAGGNGGYGGFLVVAAPTITVGGSGVISADGGNGGGGFAGANGAGGNAGGGGGGAGGGGGSGGVVALIYHVLTNGGTISANAGSGGSGGTHGNLSGSGSNGTDGQTGTGGLAGFIFEIQN